MISRLRTRPNSTSIMSALADNVHVTKLAAAKRQLMAAIRMFFDGEDELAVHTVASAAYRLVSDLKSQRGRDEVSDVWRTAMFYNVKAFVDGTLPGRLAEDKKFVLLMREISHSIGDVESLEYDEFQVLLPEGYATAYWRWWNRSSNFLKHADRDSEALLPMSAVDNLLLLMVTYSAYLDVAGGRTAIEPEGFVLLAYCNAYHGYYCREEIRPLVQELEPLDNDERRAFCSNYIEYIKSRWTEFRDVMGWVP